MSIHQKSHLYKKQEGIIPIGTAETSAFVKTFRAASYHQKKYGDDTRGRRAKTHSIRNDTIGYIERPIFRYIEKHDMWKFRSFDTSKFEKTRCEIANPNLHVRPPPRRTQRRRAPRANRWPGATPQIDRPKKSIRHTLISQHQLKTPCAVPSRRMQGRRVPRGKCWPGKVRHTQFSR